MEPVIVPEKFPLVAAIVPFSVTFRLELLTTKVPELNVTFPPLMVTALLSLAKDCRTLLRSRSSVCLFPLTSRMMDAVLPNPPVTDREILLALCWILDTSPSRFFTLDDMLLTVCVMEEIFPLAVVIWDCKLLAVCVSVEMFPLAAVICDCRLLAVCVRVETLPRSEERRVGKEC